MDTRASRSQNMCCLNVIERCQRLPQKRRRRAHEHTSHAAAASAAAAAVRCSARSRLEMPAIPCDQTRRVTGPFSLPLHQSSLKRKRLNASSSSLSSDSTSASQTVAAYAGARFTSPPSPRVLPLPPIRWRISATPCPLAAGLSSCDCRCEEMTNAIKCLLGIK